MTDHFFFLPGFCFLLAHEVGAVGCTEWKILPASNKIGSQEGYLAFTASHVPIYVIPLQGLFGKEGNRALTFGLDAFSAAHAVGVVSDPGRRPRSVAAAGPRSPRRG